MFALSNCLSALRPAAPAAAVCVMTILMSFVSDAGRVAHAQGRLEAEYVASLSGIPIGQGNWIVEISDSGYTAAASGATTADYNNQSAITFQTGTTAGTIQFTVQFANQPAVTQSFTIAPAQVQITSGTAVWNAPNLVVTLNGYDNTYSTGALSFVFYGTGGQVLTPTAISVNATSAFHQYFFGQSTTGGAFSVQASFPVSGDGTQVGSVAVTLSNSVGQTSNTQTFQ